MTAQTVADYFLTLGDPEVGDGISNMKIQKLLYYAQGIHLAIANEPLFDDPIEAWRFGPVVPDVYHRFKTHGFESVPVPQDFDATVFSADQRSILDEVNEAYGQFLDVGVQSASDVPAILNALWVKRAANNIPPQPETKIVLPN